MPRAHLNKSIIRKTSGLPADGSCRVYEPGTTTDIAQTIFVGDTGATPRANPFTFTAGVLDFYLDTPQRVKLVVTPSGGSAQTFEDIDVAAPAAPIPTLDTSETADIQPVGTAAADGGTGTEVALANHVHNSPLLAELRLQRIMQPGVACPSMRSATSGALPTGLTTFLTVPAGRKYVIKNLQLDSWNTTTTITFSIVLNGITFTSTVAVPATGIVSLPCALVLNAGDTLGFSTSHANFALNVAYVDLAAAESPARYYGGAVAATGAWATLVTAPANIVITSILIGNTLGTAQRVLIGRGTDGDLGYMSIPANSFVSIDTPLYLASGELLRVWQYDTSNGLNFQVSGYPAAS